MISALSSAKPAQTKIYAISFTKYVASPKFLEMTFIISAAIGLISIFSFVARFSPYCTASY